MPPQLGRRPVLLSLSLYFSPSPSRSRLVYVGRRAGQKLPLGRKGLPAEDELAGWSCPTGAGHPELTGLALRAARRRPTGALSWSFFSLSPCFSHPQWISLSLTLTKKTVLVPPRG